MPERPVVLLADPLDADAEGRLARSARVVRPATREPETLRAAIAECDALIVRSGTRVTRELMSAGRRLRAVGTASVGVDHIDVGAARELNVAVLNVPLANAEAVAEFTVGLILQLLRPIPRLAAAYAAGEFRAARERAHGPEMSGLTVGIVGMGRVGSRVGRICAAGFGARVVYNDIVAVGPFEFAARCATKDELWRAADIVTLHVPLTPETRGMVDAGVLARMKPGARLINTARGGVVDAAALEAALRSGRLAGAALDVTEPEPLPAGHPLRGAPNVILTPHVAARTEGALRRMYGIVDEVLRFLSEGS